MCWRGDRLTMDIVVAPDPQGAANEAAAWIARHLRNAVSRRGEASVAFSGGSTPALMLLALASFPVPWEATTIFQVDERVAPDDDPDRNAAAARGAAAARTDDQADAGHRPRPRVGRETVRSPSCPSD